MAEFSGSYILLISLPYCKCSTLYHFRVRPIWRWSLQKNRTLKSTLESLVTRMAPFNRPRAISYSSSILATCCRPIVSKVKRDIGRKLFLYLLLHITPEENGWEHFHAMFLPRDAMQARSLLSRSVCLSVCVDFYLYPTVGTVLIHSVKPELTE